MWQSGNSAGLSVSKWRGSLIFTLIKAKLQLNTKKQVGSSSSGYKNVQVHEILFYCFFTYGDGGFFPGSGAKC
jgi:hypothetical protein